MIPAKIDGKSVTSIGGGEFGTGAFSGCTGLNEMMEALLKRTVHFRIGKKPTRKEMNER